MRYFLIENCKICSGCSLRPEASPPDPRHYLYYYEFRRRPGWRGGGGGAGGGYCGGLGAEPSEANGCVRAKPPAAGGKGVWRRSP